LNEFDRDRHEIFLNKENDEEVISSMSIGEVFEFEDI
jgi:hypothetical protein